MIIIETRHLPPSVNECFLQCHRQRSRQGLSRYRSLGQCCRLRLQAQGHDQRALHLLDHHRPRSAPQAVRYRQPNQADHGFVADARDRRKRQSLRARIGSVGLGKGWRPYRDRSLGCSRRIASAEWGEDGMTKWLIMDWNIDTHEQVIAAGPFDDKQTAIEWAHAFLREPMRLSRARAWISLASVEDGGRKGKGPGDSPEPLPVVCSCNSSQDE